MTATAVRTIVTKTAKYGSNITKRMRSMRCGFRVYLTRSNVQRRRYTIFLPGRIIVWKLSTP
eukprot:scaffold1068_cov167-Amphora_coffeaeformis.AAC.40